MCFFLGFFLFCLFSASVVFGTPCVVRNIYIPLQFVSTTVRVFACGIPAAFSCWQKRITRALFGDGLKNISGVQSWRVACSAATLMNDCRRCHTPPAGEAKLHRRRCRQTARTASGVCVCVRLRKAKHVDHAQPSPSHLMPRNPSFSAPGGGGGSALSRPQAACNIAAAFRYL